MTRFEKILAVCVALLMASGFLALLILDRSSAEWLCLEDHPVENLGAGALFLAFLLSMDSARRVRKQRASDAYRPLALLAFLGLGAVYFFGFGEEISWGQRIFNDATPQWLDKINEQHETTVHNITVTFLGVGLHVWIKWAVYGFLLAYFAVLPILRSSHQKTAGLVERLGIPVAPVWLSAYVFVVFLVHSAFQGRFAHGTVNWPLDEMCETLWEVLLAVAALVFWRQLRKPQPNHGEKGEGVSEQLRGGEQVTLLEAEEEQQEGRVGRS